MSKKQVRKILCCCIAGLGSSFMVSMNVKKALTRLGIEGITVDHAGINDAFRGAADLFVVSSDVFDQVSQVGDTIPINRLTDKEEIYTKLKDYFDAI